MIGDFVDEIFKTLKMRPRRVNRRFVRRYQPYVRSAADEHDLDSGTTSTSIDIENVTQMTPTLDNELECNRMSVNAPTPSVFITLTDQQPGSSSCTDPVIVDSNNIEDSFLRFLEESPTHDMNYDLDLNYSLSSIFEDLNDKSFYETIDPNQIDLSQSSSDNVSGEIGSYQKTHKKLFERKDSLCECVIGSRIVVGETFEGEIVKGVYIYCTFCNSFDCFSLSDFFLNYTDVALQYLSNYLKK